jgi:apolipoprotein N-acyltransferase
MRAIEYGIPLIRVANTGITAFIDHYGRIVSKIDLNQEGVVDVDLIKSNGSSFYFKYGNIATIIIVLIAIIFIIQFPKLTFNQKDET